MNNEVSKETIRSYRITVVIGVVCMAVMVFATSYSYFKARIEGDGKSVNVLSGNVVLEVSENKISASGVAPIRDADKDSKASINNFTVKRSSDSNLAVCYNVYLVIDSISSNIKNSEYLKYELSNGSTTTLGNFSTVSYESDGTGRILIASNVSKGATDTTSDSYSFKLWLSYSDSEDQSALLGGSINAHIEASGKSGTC